MDRDSTASTDGGAHHPAAEPRETSGATTALVIGHLRQRGGPEAVAEVLRRSGVPFTAEELSDQSRWTSYDTRIRLFAAATEVLGDPDAMFTMGAESLSLGLNNSLVLLVRAMGSPRAVYRQLPRAVAKFSTTSTMQVLESGATHATIHYQLHEGYRHSRLDCSYARGLISMVPTIFGLAPAYLVHDECESDGHPACVYHLVWDRRARGLRRRRTPVQDHELTALRGQLRDLQEAAADLVASDDLTAVLESLVQRAARAVLAPAHLLAVHPPGGGEPLVHSSGLPPADVPALAGRLLDDGDLGPQAVVVDVTSAHRRHGRLAAIYPPGAEGMVHEHAMLGAYAGHAAAALDLLIARDDARREAERAQRLLALANALTAATDATEVCTVVADALPAVVGCTSAGVLLWEPERATLRSRASAGLSDQATAVLRGSALSAEDVPELVAMLTDREPRVLGVGVSSPVLRRLLDRLGLSYVVAVPLLAGDVFLGIATASWEAGQARGPLDGEVLVRLRGVADQAATALQNARLLEAIRHQASHDALTGLPNRVLFAELLEAGLAGCGPDDELAVLYCDIDRFKQVNDEFGHAAGDELLRQFAARLRATVRPGDTVSRLSGDEFALVLPVPTSADDAAAVADRVLEGMREPFRVEGRELVVTTSVGVAVQTGSGGQAEELLRVADSAMYRAKQSGRHQPTR